MSPSSPQAGPPFSELLEQALRVASAAHGQQRRRGSDVPYFSHSAAVALILARAGFTSDALLAAAVLHDVIEDTHVTVAQLAGQFPDEVVEMVVALSETKTGDDGQLRPWEDRKAEHLEQIARAPRAARAIALADKLHNLTTMWLDLAAGTLDWSAFRAPPDRLLRYHSRAIEAAAAADEALAPLAEACRAAWERLYDTVNGRCNEPQPRAAEATEDRSTD